MTQATFNADGNSDRPVGAACGKVILLGEHAVVYGVPALCGALNGGAEITAIPGRGALRVPAWSVVTPPAGELLAPAVRAPGALPDEVAEPVASATGAAGNQSLLHAYRAILRSVLSAAQRRDDDLVFPYDFVARFAIPTGAGLGSSAALSVALVRALDQTLGLQLAPRQVDAAALAAEQVFHGHPSGLDHTIAQHGGFGLFRRGHGLTPLYGTPELRLCIGHTGRARDTKGRVSRVAELHREAPAEIGACFARIAALVDEAVAALRQAAQITQDALGDVEGARRLLLAALSRVETAAAATTQSPDEHAAVQRALCTVLLPLFDLAHKEGDTVGAMSYGRRAIETEAVPAGRAAELHNFLGQAALATGSTFDAIHHFESALRSEPGQLEPTRALVALLYPAGEFARIDLLITQALSAADGGEISLQDGERAGLLRQQAEARDAETALAKWKR